MAPQRLDIRRARRRDQASGQRPISRAPRSAAPASGRRRAWTRLVRSRADAVAVRLTLPAAGALAAAWVAALTLTIVAIVVLGSWITGAGGGGADNALRMSGLGWLAAHRVPIQVAGGTFSALPWGFVVVPGYILWRAGVWAARRSGACRWQDVRVTVAVASAVYGSFGLLIGLTCSMPSASVEPVRALLGPAVLAAVAFGAGASREAGLLPTLGKRVPAAARGWLRGSLAAVAALLTGSALLLAISLAAHFGTALDMERALGAGFIGGILLLVLCVATLPNAVIWVMAYSVGPGFAVGTGTSVSPFGVEAGAVPAFPLLAAVPVSAPAWGPVVLLLPVIAGAVAALVHHPAGPPRLIGRAQRDRAFLALAAGAAVGVLCALATGSLGSGRMAVLGPDVIPAALAAAGLIFIGSWLADLVRHLGRAGQARRVRRRPAAGPQPAAR